MPTVQRDSDIIENARQGARRGGHRIKSSSCDCEGLGCDGIAERPAYFILMSKYSLATLIKSESLISPYSTSRLFAGAYQVIPDANLLRLKCGGFHSLPHLKRARVHIMDLNAGLPERGTCFPQIDLEIAQRIVGPAAGLIGMRGGSEESENGGLVDIKERSLDGGPQRKAAGRQQQNETRRQQTQPSHAKTLPWHPRARHPNNVDGLPRIRL